MNNTIGESLKEKRIEKGYTQTDFSKKCGVSRSYIVEIELNKYTNISIYILCEFCKVLECTPNDLIPMEFYR